MQHPSTKHKFYCIKCRENRYETAEFHKSKGRSVYKSACSTCGTGLFKVSGRDTLFGRKLTKREIWQRQESRRRDARKQKLAAALGNLPTYRVELIDKSPQ